MDAVPGIRFRRTHGDRFKAPCEEICRTDRPAPIGCGLAVHVGMLRWYRYRSSAPGNYTRDLHHHRVWNIRIFTTFCTTDTDSAVRDWQRHRWPSCRPSYSV